MTYKKGESIIIRERPWENKGEERGFYWDSKDEMIVYISEDCGEKRKAHHNNVSKNPDAEPMPPIAKSVHEAMKCWECGSGKLYSTKRKMWLCPWCDV